jgi:hypothetical protein
VVRRFDSSRFSFADRLGLVGRRSGSTWRPIAIFSANRFSASSRFRAWPRASWATASTRGPSRLTSRSRCSSVRACEATTLKTASIRESVTLACWPPGPEERLARSSISESGIERLSSIFSSSAAAHP